MLLRKLPARSASPDWKPSRIWSAFSSPDSSAAGTPAHQTEIAKTVTIMRDRKIVDNVAWSYEQPVDGASIIAGHIAFAPSDEHAVFGSTCGSG